MAWISERYSLREDQQGRLVYFPFGLVGYGYEVTSPGTFAWLRRQERLRGIGFFVAFFGATMLQVALEARWAKAAVFVVIVLGYIVVTGAFLVYSTPGLQRLQRQPGAVEREAETVGVGIGRAFVRLQATNLLVVLLGLLAAFWLGVEWFGALVIAAAVYFGIQATRDYSQLRRIGVGGAPPPTAPN